jgi:hypothetical protein
MNEQELDDRVLLAVRRARPAIDESALSPESADAIAVIERVLHGEESRSSDANRGQWGIPKRRFPTLHSVSRPRIGAITVGAAVAVVAAAAIVLSGISGGPSLVDRAYADITAGHLVVHEVDIRTDPSLHGYYERMEGWLLPADDRTRMINITGYVQHPYRTVSEWVTTATGRVYGRACLSGCRVGNVGAFLNGHSPWQYAGTVAQLRAGVQLFGTLPGTFTTWFRTAYRAHAIVADGTARFDGKHAARFESMAPTFGSRIVFWRPGTPLPRIAAKDRSGVTPYSLIDWYIDPATAQPLGFTASPCANEKVRSCGAPVSSTRIVTFERLQPTAQNLTMLTGPNPPAGAR